MEGPEDALGPRELHPIFFGSFDWHSCVHGYWLLLRTRRLHPDLPVAAPVAALLDEMLAPGKVAGELAYLDRAYTGTFERPYGWAWLLALHREAQRHEQGGWARHLGPLALAFADRFKAFLPRLTYPIRTGTHGNTAFALILALDWAGANDAALADLIRARAVHYFGEDRECPGWEPAGDDFLSCRPPTFAPGSTPSCPISPPAPRAACSARPSSPTAPTARSPISTASI
jgi:hypothetical protein